MTFRTFAFALTTFAALTGMQRATPDIPRTFTPVRAEFDYDKREVEIPIALPVIISGVRNAAVLCIAIAAIATYIGAGGLGSPTLMYLAAAGVGASRSAGVACAFGNSDCSRSFQVISGTAASILGSVPASISESAPPYDPPVTPTRGSPAPSCTTSGCSASQSTIALASGTS